MIVDCATCRKQYDDATSWTICPHRPLDMAPDLLLCRRCDVFLGYTNLFTPSPDPDRCSVCGRTRAELEAEA